MSLNLVMNMKWQQVLVVMMVCSALLVGMVQEAQMDATATIENLVVEKNSIAFSVESQKETGTWVFPEFKGQEWPALVNVEEGFFQSSTTMDFIMNIDNLDYEKSQNPNLEESYISPTLTISFPVKALAELSDDEKFLAFYIRTWSHVSRENKNDVAEGYITRFFLPEGAESPFIDKVTSGYEEKDGVGYTISLSFLEGLYGSYPNSIIKIQSQVIRIRYKEEAQGENASSASLSNLGGRQRNSKIWSVSI